jgi:4-amino-4-deoxy-L-arabinose transferase-like glycosyltransferase
MEFFAEQLGKRKSLLIISLTILYSVSTYVLAKRKLMWNDELYSYYIARLPTMADVWGALMAGGEQTPPLFYVITRASIALFGANNLGLRMPEMIGFWVMSLCLFFFVARRTSNLYGLIAAFFPLITGAYSYAYEARPYGLVLGFGALALLCWQSATMDRLRTLSIICLAMSLAAALSSHYYGIFVIFPLALGETVRSLTRRRVDVPVWAAFGLAITPLIWHLPLIQQARAYSGTFWAQPQWMGISDFYNNLLYSAVLPLTAIVFLAGIYAAFFRSPSDEQNLKRSITPPIYEITAALGFLVIPVICVILAKFVTGAFTDRYAISAIIGFSVLIAFVAAKLFENTAFLAATLIICFVGWFGILQLEALQRVSNNSLGAAVKLFETENESNLPIIASDPHTFIELAHYAPPEITSRLVYLADPAASLKQLGHNSVERGMVDLLGPWFHLNVTDYNSYVVSHPRFLIYGNLGFLNWVTNRLKEDGMRSELRGRNGDKFLFLVEANEKKAYFPSNQSDQSSPAR